MVTLWGMKTGQDHSCWRMLDKMTLSAIKTIAEGPEAYRFEGIVYRKADTADKPAIHSILDATPMSSWIVLSSHFMPDYFASKNLFGNKETILASLEEDNSKIVGMCAYTSMLVHINGIPTSVGYLGELRVLPEYRRKLRILRNGFKTVRLVSQNEASIADWYTSIASDNRVARRLLEANLKKMPAYTPLGEMVTFAIQARTGRIKYRMQQATTEDIPKLAGFYNQQVCGNQYSPVLTQEWLNSLDGKNGLRIQDFYVLREEGDIRACFALWDQRKIKQTVVCRYRFPINIVRRPYNLFAKLTGRVVLPGPGESINYIFIAFFAIDARIGTEFRDMISFALGQIRTRNAELGMLGLSAKNPLTHKMSSFPCQTYRTYIERVTWRDNSKEMGDNNHLFDMPVQPEIAIL